MLNHDPSLRKEAAHRFARLEVLLDQVMANRVHPYIREQLAGKRLPAGGAWPLIRLDRVDTFKARLVLELPPPLKGLDLLLEG